MLKIQPGCNANPPMGVHRVKAGQQQYCVIAVRVNGCTISDKGLGEIGVKLYLAAEWGAAVYINQRTACNLNRLPLL